MSQLRRIKSGNFTVEDAISLEVLESAVNWDQIIEPPDKGLLEIKPYRLNAYSEKKFQTGQPVSATGDNLGVKSLEIRRMYSEDNCFLGLAKFDHLENAWRAVKVLQSPLYSDYSEREVEES